MKSAPWLPEEEMSAPKPVVAIPMITSWAIGHRRTMRPLFISYFHTILAIFFGPGIYLTIVNTEFRSSSSFSLLSLSFAFVPLRDTQESNFYGPSYFGQRSGAKAWTNPSPLSILKNNNLIYHWKKTKYGQHRVKISYKKQNTWKKKKKILQGLGVAQAAVTERWQWKEENPTKICVFFSYKNKNSI